MLIVGSGVSVSVCNESVECQLLVVVCQYQCVMRVLSVNCW